MDDKTNLPNPTDQAPSSGYPAQSPIQEPTSASPTPPATSAPIVSTNPPQPNSGPFPTQSATAVSPLVTVSAQDPETEATALQKTANVFTTIFAGIFSWIIFPIMIVLVLHFFVFQAYHVVGTSMSSTLLPSDYLIISKVGYSKYLVDKAFKKDAKYIPTRGEIIVFHYPRDPSEVFVKRVVGLPGDHIVIKGGKVTLYNKDKPNGFNPDVKYEKADTVTLIDTDETVAAGSVFVMGDNRTPGGSYDSREWGQLESSYIIGNAVLRLLPLDQARVL